MKKTLLVLALVLVMLLQMVPFTAFAETEAAVTEETALADLKAEKASAPQVAAAEDANGQSTPIEGASLDNVVANPLYPESAEKAKEAHLNSRNVETAQKAPQVAVYNVADALDYFTGRLEARQRYINFDVWVSFYPYAEHLEAMFLLAMEHNGKPTQGDYILWHWSTYAAGGSFYRSGSGYVIEAEFEITYMTTYSQESALTNRVNQIINGFGFNANTTAYEKAYKIYEWVTANITYDYDGLNAGEDFCHTAYKGVMQGTCVCQGYASIMYRMLLQVGVPARVVAGDSGGPHGWNIAQIDGWWYNLDSTWDAGYRPEYWDYFLVCPANFDDEHVRWNKGYPHDYGSAEFYEEHPMASSDYIPVPKYNGVVQVDGVWGYYIDGQLQSGYTGLVWWDNVWFYVEQGIIDWQYTGLVPYEGNMFYVQNNVLDWGYTGLGYLNDGWYYIENALLKMDYTGLTCFSATGEWFYVVNGTVDWTYTGMVPYNGNWFYIQANHLDWSYTGLGWHEDVWYFFLNARMQADYNGLVYFNNTWFYIENGVLTWSTNGLRYYDGKLYYLIGSVVDWSYNGYANYNGVDYYVTNGVVIL